MGSCNEKSVFNQGKRRTYTVHGSSCKNYALMYYLDVAKANTFFTQFLANRDPQSIQRVCLAECGACVLMSDLVVEKKSPLMRML